jgi:hypothetical protein
MDTLKKDLATPSAWKSYLLTVAKFLLIFYAATLGLALLFTHRGQEWIIPGILVGAVYLTIIIFSLRQMLKKLPMAAIMLAAPMVPLFMLILVISLILVL